MNVTPKSFIFQMKMLNFFGYKGLSISQLKPYLDGEKTGKVVGLTFDDGYQNNLKNAAPIMHKYEFSATVYLVSKNIGLYNSWDLHKNISKRKLMTVDEVKEWIGYGMDIGAHTENHIDLTKVSKEKMLSEIKNCKTNLERIFKTSIDDFCYPYGKFDKEVTDIVRKCGFSTATSMIRGRANLESSHLELPRVPITYHTLPHLFLAKIYTDYEDRRSWET